MVDHEAKGVNQIAKPFKSFPNQRGQTMAASPEIYRRPVVKNMQDDSHKHHVKDRAVFVP
jgi:hypothetical protein